MAFHDLRDVLGFHAAVPDLLGIDDDADAARALVEATRRVGADGPLQALLVQDALECVAHGVGALVGAAALGIAGLALVGADEDMTLVVRFGHCGRYTRAAVAARAPEPGCVPDS